MKNPVAIVGLTLTLAGCAQPPSAPPPSVGALSALVDGPVESSYLESLKPALKLVQYTGSQKPEEYDLLIVDGDHHTPAALSGNTLVQAALDHGKWVLAVDVTAEHKRDGLGTLLHATSQGASRAYAVHLGQDARGRPEVQMVEVPGSGGVDYQSSAEGANTVRDAGQRVASEAQRSSATAFANDLIGRLSIPWAVRPLALPDLPADIIYTTYHFSTIRTWTVSNPGGASQHPNYTANYDFTVFLNNRNNPQGDFQYVTLDADVTASPRSSGEDFVAYRSHTDSNWTDYYDEWGWFQTAWNVSVALTFTH